jgi:molybdopterin synthase catalytic subunit
MSVQATRAPVDGFHVEISSVPIDVVAWRSWVRSPRAGAVATFEGVVRNHDRGRGVSELEYSAHPGAGVILGDLVAGVLRHHEDVASIVLVHRVGTLAVGDIAIFCAVSAPHRRAAFLACADAVEIVKHQLPVWKRQLFTGGGYEWVNSG